VWRLGVIYAVVVLATLCSLFFGPARMAVIGDVVPAEQRARASGLGQITQNIATLAGPPAAAPLFVGLGPRWALLIDACSFAFSFAMILLLQVPDSDRSVADGAAGNAWREAREGLAFFAHSRVLTTLLGAGVLIMLGGGAINALDVFFVTHTLHAGTALFGLMDAALGAGMLLAALTASALAPRLDMARLFWVSVLATAALIVLYSRLTSFVPALVVLFVAGVPMSVLNVALMPLVLQVTPREMIGRVGGVLGPGIGLASVAGIAGSGVLAGTVLGGFHAQALGMTFGPVDTVFTAAGVLGLLGGALAMWGLRGVSCRARQNQPREAPEPADVPA
jgi:Na+/melibiose symporter-like transporter